MNDIHGWRSHGACVVYFLAFTLLGFSHWLGASFDDPSIDQILYHLRYSEGLGVDVGRVFLFTFAMECIVFPLAFAGAVCALHRMALRGLERAPRDRPRLRRSMGVALPAAVLGTGAAAAMAQLSVFAWVGYHFEEDRFGRHFVDAGQAAVQPVPRAGELKNLVLIYVESLEDTYGDEKLWGRDLLRPLRDIGGVSFGGYRSAPGTNWTIAGIVATQCGVPLKVVSYHDMKPRVPGERTFLAGATCLGDILKRHGYRNVFLGGAPLSFSGKGTFLRDHGYDVAYGREEWRREVTAAQAYGEWGLHDDALFAQARLKLGELHASGQRFNLTLLTLDTHNPRGFASPECRQRGIRSFEDLVECASRQTADFVQFIERSGYLKDTQVVILGDHLAVSNPVYDALRGIRERRIFNRFVSAHPPTGNTQDIVPFDLFPTLLEFVGFTVPGERLGLGYSAFGPARVPRAPERLEDLVLPSLAGSASYARRWDAP
jgi:phosphoglycerol transferase